MGGIQTNDEVINPDNIRPDGQVGSNRNQVTRVPTARPTKIPSATSEHVQFEKLHDSATAPNKGNTNQIDAQTGVVDMPTMSPTHYPTKDRSDTDDENSKGTVCSDGTFIKPVGWVGAGPGDQFCNVWKCNPGKTEFTKGNHADNQGHFSKQVRACNIKDRETSVNYCSHTTCSFSAISSSNATNVIKVRSDHREMVGGYHKCGLAHHGMQGGYLDNNEMGSHLDSTDHSPAGRPACDCICYGMDDTGVDAYGNPHVPENLRLSASRRQDVAGFERALNTTRVVPDDHEPTNSSGTYDTAYNSNNFYSKHSNNGAYTTSTIASSLQGQATTYSENDHTYAGQRVAHKHVNTDIGS